MGAQREEQLARELARLRDEVAAAKVRALQRTREVVASEDDCRARAAQAEAAAAAVLLERNHAACSPYTLNPKP